MWSSRNLHCRRFCRPLAAAFVLAAALVGSMGVSCDNNAAASFRQTATPQIGEGVKTIVDGILDGMIQAIQDAGDGSTGTTQ